MPAKTGVDKPAICPACGAEAGSGSAEFCPVCGKLMREDYQPLDVIRSSYGLQQKRLKFAEAGIHETELLFAESRNLFADIAWACVVYSAVPYLGILFVPFALIAGGLGWYKARHRTELGGGKLALVCAGLSILIFAVQIFLWWLLYLIPKLGV